MQQFVGTALVLVALARELPQILGATRQAVARALELLQA